MRDISVPAIDKMIADQSWICKICEQQSDQAYYARKEDKIVVPMREQFPDRGAFYGTLFHEMTHSTGIDATISEHNLQYLKSWMGALSDEPKAITQIVADAARAADFISEKAKLDQRPTIDLSDIGKELEVTQEQSQSQDIGHHAGMRR